MSTTKLNKGSIIYLKLKGFNSKQLLITMNRLVKQSKMANLKISEPVSLPTKKRIYCLLRSPHVNKDAREHFEIRTYTKLIAIDTLYFFNFKFFIPSGLKIILVKKL